MARQSVSPGADQREDCASDGVPGGAFLRTPLAARLTTVHATRLRIARGPCNYCRVEITVWRLLAIGQSRDALSFPRRTPRLQARDTRHFSTMLQPSPTSA